MIKNELQYKRTKSLALELKHALQILPSNEEFLKEPDLVRRAHVGSVKRQLAQFERELTEYEKLRSGEFNFSCLPEIEKVPIWLIQARIARGLGQEELAKLLNLKKQQIQHYEATEYASASLSRILEIAHVLQEGSG